jgi:hypothetical protein
VGSVCRLSASESIPGSALSPPDTSRSWCRPWSSLISFSARLFASWAGPRRSSCRLGAALNVSALLIRISEPVACSRCGGEVDLDRWIDDGPVCAECWRGHAVGLAFDSTRGRIVTTTNRHGRRSLVMTAEVTL